MWARGVPASQQVPKRHQRDLEQGLVWVTAGPGRPREGEPLGTGSWVTVVAALCSAPCQHHLPGTEARCRWAWFQRHGHDKIWALCTSPEHLPVCECETVSAWDFHFFFFFFNL